MRPPIIELDNVEVVYQSKNERVQAIQPNTFQIEEGEFICLVGPSGCGKSTLLKLMAGYIQPTQGKILMEGNPIAGPDSDKGVVFQAPTLYPWLTVRKNIDYGLKVRGIAKETRQKEVDFFLEQVGLKDSADRYPFELSGGMKQRVAVARSLVNHPKLLLMDEPFGALDALTRIQMQAFLREIWQKNKQTIFLITHDIDEAMALGTRILVMSKSPGTIIEELQLNYSREALSRPENQVVEDEQYLQIKKQILEKIYQ